jgi:predicted dehydrogenase
MQFRRKNALAEKKISRREALKTAAVAAGVFTIVPRHVLGGPGYTPPSETITRALIGCGGMGVAGHIGYDYGPLLALCDVDKGHLNHALDVCTQRGYKGINTYTDWREVIDRKDIDVVHLPVPPHWHAIIGIAAANAGKDLWAEKPMTRTIGEGLKLRDAVQRNERIFRVNTYWRYERDFFGLGAPIKTIKKMAMHNMLGWPIKAYLGEVHGFEWKTFMWSGIPGLKEEPIPRELDYDMWLGPAPYKPYNHQRVHQHFRGYWDYDGGGLGDQAQHFLDPVQYALGKDDTSPVEVEADAYEQTAYAVQPFRKVWLRYADGCEITIDATVGDPNTPIFEGPEGKVFAGMKCSIPDWEKKLAQLPDPEPMETDFRKCVLTRRPFCLNEHVSHRTCTMINLAKAAVRTGRKLRFDPEKFEYVDAPQMNLLVDEPMRAPWSIS